LRGGGGRAARGFGGGALRSAPACAPFAVTTLPVALHAVRPEGYIEPAAPVRLLAHVEPGGPLFMELRAVKGESYAALRARLGALHAPLMAGGEPLLPLLPQEGALLWAAEFYEVKPHTVVDVNVLDSGTVKYQVLCEGKKEPKWLDAAALMVGRAPPPPPAEGKGARKSERRC